LIVMSLPGLIGMQLNLPDSGTFLFISDHCHVIENVCRTFLFYFACLLYRSSPFLTPYPSGVMVFPKGGWLATTQPGSRARSDSSVWRPRQKAELCLDTTKSLSWRC
jgi:hypothetical protein